MSREPDRSATPSGPVGVRLMVDFSTGRIIGARRPGQPTPPPQPPRSERGDEPTGRAAA